MLWKGPHVDGITFSLLNNFLECRERFWLKVGEGLVEDEGLKSAIEFGQMWHEAEAQWSANKNQQTWVRAVKRYKNQLLRRYPSSSQKTEREEIDKWYQICIRQFPIYLTYWEQEESKKKPFLQEVPFRVPYQLPSGRKVFLRGKWDSVYLPHSSKYYWLQENKTKGRIDIEGINASVHLNLQTMLYLVALKTEYPKEKFAGVVYNVIRRPLGEPKFTLYQRKGREVWNSAKTAKYRKGEETSSQFYNRIQQDIASRPAEYFMRWRVNLYKQDFLDFQQKVFDPLLENLYDWWAWVSCGDRWRIPSDEWIGCVSCPGGGIHYQSPFGVWNSLSGGFRGSYFEYITKGNKQGLVKIKTLYPELEA